MSGIPTLQIQFLGHFSITFDEQPLNSLNTSRLQSLLAYLVLHRTVQISRRHLAFTFWPNKTESQAKNNLRQLLYQLRQALPDSDRFLFADTGTLGWQQNASFRLDVLDFENAVAVTRKTEQAKDLHGLKSNLEHGLSLYRGELLPNCYDDWIIPERERLHQMYLRCLEKIVNLVESQRSYKAALPYARKLLRTDPLNENNYRKLMRLYALNGERANALHTYHQCVDTLQREIGVKPESETQETYHRLSVLEDQTLFSPSAPAITVIPPLVGREVEWQQMVAVWESIETNGTRCILLEGEAGVGKSRLAEEMLSWVARQGFYTARTRAYAAEGGLAYGPISDWLRSEAIRPLLKNLEKVWQREIARLLPELLIESPDLPPPDPLKESWQRQGFYQALMQAFLSIPQPFLLLIDDLQWCDSGTLEWLHYLLRAEALTRLVVVGTVRLEELMANQALQDLLLSLRNSGAVIEIKLNPLDAAETARLAAHLTGRELEIPIALHLFKESEGNPLFALEMIRSGIMQTTSEKSLLVDHSLKFPRELADESHLPPKVQSILLARLKTLSPSARQLASLAATVGRAFSFEVLAQASDSSEEDLLRWLDELWQHYIVLPLTENTYDFSHDKLREVAYNQASLPRRRSLHRRVAQALEIVHGADIETFSGQLAVHFDKAGQPDRAIHYYAQAASVEQRINANREAASLLERALKILGVLPADQSRDELELDLQTALGVSLIGILGHGAPEVMKVYNRALALCQRLELDHTPPLLGPLITNHITRAEFKQALRYSEQFMDLSGRLNDPLLAVEANYLLGVSNDWLGNLQESRIYLEKAISLYDPEKSDLHTLFYSHDPRVICLTRLAFVLWRLGYPARAMETGQLALNYAREISHPYSFAYSYVWNVFMLMNMRSHSLAIERAETLAAYSRKYLLRHFLLENMVLQGWMQAEQGEIASGVVSMRENMQRFRSVGAEFKRPFFLSVLAELVGRQGDIQQAQELFTEAITTIEKSEERWCQAEILRRQGELLAMQSNDPGAEEVYQQAIRVARNQGARMLELRAALSLGRLWLRQGKYNQVKAVLAPIYNWFTEGLDTPDLQDAYILLAEVESNSGN